MGQLVPDAQHSFHEEITRVSAVVQPQAVNAKSNPQQIRGLTQKGRLDAMGELHEGPEPARGLGAPRSANLRKPRDREVDEHRTSAGATRPLAGEPQCGVEYGPRAPQEEPPPPAQRGSPRVASDRVIEERRVAQRQGAEPNWGAARGRGDDATSRGSIRGICATVNAKGRKADVGPKQIRKGGPLQTVQRAAAGAAFRRNGAGDSRVAE